MLKSVMAGPAAEGEMDATQYKVDPRGLRLEAT